MSDDGGGAGGADDGPDTRVEWLKNRIKVHYARLKAPALRKALDDAALNTALVEFCTSEAVSMLVLTGDKMTASFTLPKKAPKGKQYLFIKVAPDNTVSKDNIAQDVITQEVLEDPLEDLRTVVQELYIPLVAAPANQESWSEVQSKEILDEVNAFLNSVIITQGHTKGHTTLPLPVEPAGDDDGGAALDTKDRIHLLEGSVITWTKQIKDVLKVDPEDLLKAGLHPTPDIEIAFWTTKAANLNAIFSQLQSDNVRRILKYLDRAKSTYCAPFAKLCKEVFTARLEANDNVKYLRTLDEWFDRLRNDEDFDKLPELFKPMMHIILLVWKNSSHYNTAARLVVLIREICNALIAQATRYINGKAVFEMIAEEDAATAVKQLKACLTVCGAFKSTYMEYRATANAECLANPWRIQNTVLFSRLDSFLERTHDTLDMVETIMQFSMLARIEIGGTKGKTLTESSMSIYEDFEAAVKEFKSVTYDIMDVQVRLFEDDYYAFRVKIKVLERRLGAILTQAFDDCATIDARFKLLDSFDALLDRPLIQDELEKKHIALVLQYGADLKATQELFVSERDEPPIASNYPPIAGALTWCRSLKGRIEDPMRRLKLLSKTIMTREEAKEVVKTYDALMTSLSDYEQSRIEEWGSDVASSSEAKLKLPLLTRKDDPEREGSGITTEQTLDVNFDPGLVKLLREVRYFLLLGLSVPESALAVYQKGETFRKQTGQLDLIVNKYNEVMQTMLPVEAPLLRKILTKCDADLYAGMKDLNWKSAKIKPFIDKVMQPVDEAHGLLKHMKQNLDVVEATLRTWSASSMMQRKTKPVKPDEFQHAFKALKKNKLKEIKEGGKQVEKCVKDSHAILKVSKTHEDWRSYVDFVSNIVVTGLSQTVLTSLNSLSDALSKEHIEKTGAKPMIEIQMELVYSAETPTGVYYDPPIGEAGDGTGMRELVDGWLASFFNCATTLKRLDDPGGPGNYVKEMAVDPEVRLALSDIEMSMEDTMEACNAFAAEYEEMEYLWTTNLDDMFSEFLSKHYAATEKGGPVLPDLDAFEAELTKYEELADVISHKPKFRDIMWLRVNAEPMNMSLLTLVSKWRHKFASWMQNYVHGELQGLSDFIDRVTAGLDQEIDENNVDQEKLKGVMGYIRDVKKNQDARKASFKPLEQAVHRLKGHDISLDSFKVKDMPVLNYLETAELHWDHVVDHTFKKREEIYPMQLDETTNTKTVVREFFEGMRVFRNSFRKNSPQAFTGAPAEAYASIDDFESQLVEYESKSHDMNELSELFELPVSKYAELSETRKELRMLKLMWDFRALVETTFESWNSELWSTIDTDALEDEVKKLQVYLKKSGDANANMKGWSSYRDIEGTVKNMAITLPLINDLHSPAMRDRHWKSLSTVCNLKKAINPNVDTKMNFEDLVRLNLFEHEEDVGDVVETATKELKIEKKMTMIEGVWGGLTLDYVPHKDSDVHTVKPSDEVIETLEEHQMELQTIVGMGKFVDYFRERVERWQKNLGNVESVLKEWMSVTKAWASLESIFLGSADIRAQLPDDTKRFEGIDQEFKDLMKTAVETPNVVEVCTAEGREESLKGMTKNLELCQKSLNEYLDMKKKIFPRFYFVSTVALLDILSNGNNPPKIMPYIGDCFDSLNSLAFEPAKDENTVPNVTTSMTAKDGEKIDLYKPFVITGAVENWLNDLNDVQRDNIAFIMENAIETAVNWEVEKPRQLWLEDYPAQVVLTVCLVYWTEETQASLEELEGGQDDAVKKYYGVCNDRLNLLIERVLGDLTKALRRKIISVITIDVHNRDVVQKLIEKKAENPLSFEWGKQLRFYWEGEGRQVHVRITDYKGTYAYEWVGNSGRLVITPLTDRCYITLTLAMRLMVGGAPAGPAGTGKTETVKDLARAIAVVCYVFNCSPQMNYQTMADIFKGLAQTGGWGCFDEFNRISIEVLSVVGSQVKSVQDAVLKFSVPANREEQYRHQPAGTPPVVVGGFELNGDPITLVPSCGFFITMNPGYAGRTELPENLKALFRSCAMIRPDLALICENMLMSEGFMKARPLSIKFTTLYKLASELLSPQDHYDWGLRAVKSVLVVAGALKRQERHLEEDAVLLRALRDFNTPKMPSPDIPIFMRLIQDLFPAFYQIDTKFDEKIKQNTIDACKEHKLQSEMGFIAKVVQLQELLDVRHSVMVVGPAGAGKTEIWRMLNAGHNIRDKAETGSVKNRHIYDIVNPKAVFNHELFGYMTLAKDWKDGCLSIIMRGMSKNYKELGYSESQISKWVVLDGDVDTLWIESMNTVMDDNKVLTLVSNERIPLSSAMRLVIECNSLANASPATVSRAGMLYVNETDVGFKPFIESWLLSRENEAELAHLPVLFERFVDAIQDGMKRDFKHAIPMRIMAQVCSLCYLLEALLPQLQPKGDPDHIEAIFTYCLVWSFGGSLIVDTMGNYRKMFHELITSLMGVIKYPIGEDVPEGTTCYDWYFDPKADREDGDGNWVHWSEKVPEYEPSPIGTGPGESAFSSVVVQTVDSVRLTATMDYFIRNKHPLSFVGTAGTGKTKLVQQYLRRLDTEKFNTALMNLHYFSDSKSIQQSIESNIDKRSGRTFGPPTGKSLVVLLDDLNLPYIEDYGTQNALELLRTVIDHGFVFDRVDLDLRKLIVDCAFVAAMNPTAGSFTVTERLQRHFATVATLMPSVTDLLTIYRSIMEGHLEPFSGDAPEMGSVLAQATIGLHRSIASKFLPSATKFVYNWNMRELTNIFQGLCLAKPQNFSKTAQFGRLWIHECTRVFHDRLVTEADTAQFNSMMKASANEFFKDEDQDGLFATPLIFTTFCAQPKGAEPTYISVPVGDEGMALLSQTLVERLDDYNQSNSIMDLVLFKDAVEHVCRIVRIIANPAGNAMLIGVGGSGKQSLSRLASFIQDYEVRQLAVTAKFTVLDLEEALKEMYVLSGVKGQGVVFLLTDTQVVDDRFLVYINEMLTSGWISSLFQKDEMESLFQPLRSEAKQSGIQDTPDALLEFLISRVLRNLHVVLCFSPVGKTFRVRARRFPGLITCTAIDWFHAWPRDALESVGLRFIDDIELGTPEVKDSISKHMANVHMTVTEISVRYLQRNRRFNYVTPKSFLELIAFYRHILGEKRTYVGKLIERLDVGLSTLRKTAADVAELQVDLEHTMVKVKEKVQATDDLLVMMGKERAGAEKQQDAAKVEAEKAAAAAAAADKTQKEADAELSEAEPAMVAARAAVDCLNKASLTELKSFPKPPAGVDKITSCCLMMLEGEYKNHSWDRAKKMMGKVDAFLDNLKSYDATSMDDKLVSGLSKYTQGDPEFSYDAMVSKSSAAANLCAWVVNIYKYNRIWVKVKPLMDALSEANESKNAALGALAAVQEEVRLVEEKLQALQDQLVQATTEKQQVEELAEKCNVKLGLATRLVNGLASENERWAIEIEGLKVTEGSLVGDCLLASSFVSYIGAFDHVYRNELWRTVWLPDILERAIPISDGIDPLSMLTDDSKTARMLNDGLPADRISIENGSIITASKRWPLIIDPQLQGIKWLRKKEENDPDVQLMVLQLTQANWSRHVTNAISQGQTIIIENLGEDVDATLDPVLARAVYKKGRTMYLRLGGEEVEYDPKFRLYLQTKLTNPHYRPEIQAQCTLVNFIATEKGLEDQLLARVVNEERRDLEDEKSKLTEAFNRYKIELMELENQLLERLANAPEDILSDVPLIEGLEATKKAAVEIAVAVELGQKTEIAINKARNEYIPVAQEGAMLYFMITSLDNVEYMYQYSLDAFVLYFYKSIKTAEKSEDVTKRVLALRETLRLTIYTWVSRGLFEQHKLTLLAQLTFSLMRRNVLTGDDATFDLDAFNFLVRGPKKPGDPNPVADWLPTPAWNSILALATMEEFSKMPSDIVEASGRFKEWFTHVTPELEKLPLDWSSLDKTPMKKLLVLRCLRPDRMTIALSTFVRSVLPSGSAFVDCDNTLSSRQVLEASLADSVPASPIFFILSPGSDVVSVLDALADSFGMVPGESYHNVSMGQGQDVVAEEKLAMGHKQGHWVLLNNVHLMPRWCVELEKMLDTFQIEGSNDKFRVFLTAEPSEGIPIGILNRSIKLTNEAPTGLKANLKRAFASLSREMVDEAENKVKSILFGLSHFHAIMIERKKFGSRGYNMMYPFSLGDLKSSVICLQNYMENVTSKIPWQDLRYIFGQIMYGGHIVNDLDRALCVNYLDFFMRDELLDEMELFPFCQDEKESFKSPAPTTYDRYLEHIDTQIKGETPLAFGLHPNAEIGFRTEQAVAMFSTLMDLQGSATEGAEEGQSPQQLAEAQMASINDAFGEPKFDMMDIAAAIEDGRGPFQNVFFLECEQMHALITEIQRSLHELNLGFEGELTMSDSMEGLMQALYLDRVPVGWAKAAWPSMRPLGAWLTDLKKRVTQLQDWVAAPLEIPAVTWISGMLNPQSFLTAISQQTAQRQNLELDKLVIQTDVSKKFAHEMEGSSRDGAYITGLFILGARWDASGQFIDKSKPREMFMQMPVVTCKAVLSDKLELKGMYVCPVYKTEQRGPTWVFNSQLKTKSPSMRWMFAGVCLVMDAL